MYLCTLCYVPYILSSSTKMILNLPSREPIPTRLRNPSSAWQWCSPSSQHVSCLICFIYKRRALPRDGMYERPWRLLVLPSHGAGESWTSCSQPLGARHALKMSVVQEDDLLENVHVQLRTQPSVRTRRCSLLTEDIIPACHLARS